MSVKKTGKSRKTKLVAGKPRRGGAKSAKRQAAPKRTRTASMPRARRSSVKAPVKVARKPARTTTGSRSKIAARNRVAAALARLKKAAAARNKARKPSAKSAAARLRRAKHPAAHGKSRSVAPSKLRKSAAPRQPARNETQKVLSERRAHAAAVLALRATTRKLAPKSRESAPAAEKGQRKSTGAAPQQARAGAPAPTAGMQAPLPRPFETRPGDIRLSGFRPVPKPPGTVKLGFKPAEYIVYPAHGVGQILAIEEQEVAGFKLELFVISFAKDKMILKVPTPKTVSVGMRKLASSEVVKQALTTLTGRARVKRTMWSRRAQEYEAKINSGDLVAIAEVVRDLYRSEAQPEQSYSERQLYEAALDRVAREIAVVQKLTDTESLKVIESQLQKGPRRGKAEEGDSDAAGGDSDDGVEEAA